MWSGLVDYGGGIHWMFRTENDQVATAFAHVQDGADHDVTISGIGPGTTAIRDVLPSGQVAGYPSWVIIHVTCGAEPAVQPAARILSTRSGRPVTLSAVSQFPDRTTFTWYLGRIGDGSKRLDANGPQMTFTPTAAGTQYVWVSAMTACSTSAAEFVIEVSSSRHRAAGD